MSARGTLVRYATLNSVEFLLFTSLLCAHGQKPTTPDLGVNVLIFRASQSMAEIQAAIDKV